MVVGGGYGRCRGPGRRGREGSQSDRRPECQSTIEAGSDEAMRGHRKAFTKVRPEVSAPLAFAVYWASTDWLSGPEHADGWWWWWWWRREQCRCAGVGVRGRCRRGAARRCSIGSRPSEEEQCWGSGGGKGRGEDLS